jgi:hypothetical protein
VEGEVVEGVPVAEGVMDEEREEEGVMEGVPEGVIEEVVDGVTVVAVTAAAVNVSSTTL